MNIYWKVLFFCWLCFFFGQINMALALSLDIHRWFGFACGILVYIISNILSNEIEKEKKGA